MSTKIWDGFLLSPPPPEWAPFWGSLWEGALSAFSVWPIAQIGIIRTYTSSWSARY